MKDGKTEVTIFGQANGLYTIVHNKKTFDDMAGHWAQKDPETLASKLIINGMADRTFAPGVNTAAKLGLVQGVGEGKFSPDTVITREQMIVMIMNAVQLVQGSLYGSSISHSICRSSQYF
ncbi:S-layer homology domain-containing protein [Paenibacillus pseudetheri]|uniref:SLH domain-containing protein n=1 Tax=Paenibacillus pseudetheri TaxID=2897682 RepID=A0ABM9BET8_9BACL|nr:S-layer homology domain-containing protein [Paenibacillus pseudetheri]CAH1057318.1 hypothetical protein PAECIP111894_03476 [Paenibacillus pseudetheri]